MSPAEAKRALSVGTGSLDRKRENYRDPFEPAPKPPQAAFSCACGRETPCWMSVCQTRAEKSAADVLSGPGITIWDLP